jgi:hypothetical protein
MLVETMKTPNRRGWEQPELAHGAAGAAVNQRLWRDFSRAGWLTAAETCSLSTAYSEGSRQVRGLSRVALEVHLASRSIPAFQRVGARLHVFGPGFPRVERTLDSERLPPQQAMNEPPLRVESSGALVEDTAAQRTGGMGSNKLGEGDEVATSGEVHVRPFGQNHVLVIHRSLWRSPTNPQTRPTPPTTAGLMVFVGAVRRPSVRSACTSVVDLATPQEQRLRFLDTAADPLSDYSIHAPLLPYRYAEPVRISGRNRSAIRDFVVDSFRNKTFNGSSKSIGDLDPLHWATDRSIGYSRISYLGSKAFRPEDNS